MQVNQIVSERKKTAHTGLALNKLVRNFCRWVHLPFTRSYRYNLESDFTNFIFSLQGRIPFLSIGVLTTMAVMIAT